MSTVEVTTTPHQQVTVRAGARARSVWRGAVLGALALLAGLLVTIAWDLFAPAGVGRFALGLAFLAAAFGLLGGALTLLWRLLRGLPGSFVWAAASVLLTLALMALTSVSASIGILALGLGLLALAALMGASVGLIFGAGSAGRRVVGVVTLILALIGLGAALTWLLNPGTPRRAIPNAGKLSAGNVQPLALPNPAQPGPYTARTLTYGSGTDARRAEFGAGIALKTQPVDGSRLVEGWSAARTDYWGFDAAALSLNGRVWYPEGEGPFPLVLIVHGQHPMEEASDPGYAYLAELLASRGFIAVSVDENFLNLSPLADLLVAQGLKGENDLRGWLLLEHLRAWREWNADPASPFFGRVDLDNIALIGHSRGGEAVTLAAAYNRLPCWPEDAALTFDYGFNIRAVVGIAPVAGTQPIAGREVALQDVNYLVLHGAQDMDVFTFQGLCAYNRASFTPGGAGIKAAIYMDGANHGQFNTAWGRKDLYEPIMRVFNLRQLMPGEEQRQAAAVNISAFLEASLHGQDGYRAFFQDLRRGDGWLPETVYLSQYADARTRVVSDFEEDADLTTATLAGGQLRGEGLSEWREGPAHAKYKDMGGQVVTLGWEAGQAASYAVSIPAGALTLDDESVLVFSLADAGEQPAAEPLDLTVQLTDRAGHSARLPLSHFSLLQPRIDGRAAKAAWMSPFPTSEPVLQHFELRLGDFEGLDAGELAEVRFVFDRMEEGTVDLDEVGLRE